MYNIEWYKLICSHTMSSWKDHYDNNIAIKIIYSWYICYTCSSQGGILLASVEMS